MSVSQDSTNSVAYLTALESFVLFRQNLKISEENNKNEWTTEKNVTARKFKFV